MYAQTLVPQRSKVETRKQMLFKDGEHFDAYLAIKQLLQTATSDIRLIDGYLSPETFQTLSGKPAGVRLEVLTKPIGGPGRSPKRTAEEAQMLAAARAYNLQHGPIEIRTADTFHDRFLMIDGRDYYTIGTSLNCPGRRTFMINELTVQHAIDDLEAEWQAKWTSSPTVYR